jgi:hypothetical protein
LREAVGGAVAIVSFSFFLFDGDGGESVGIREWRAGISCPAFSREAPIMNVLLIETILDRYVAKAERRQSQWSAKEVEVLLLRLREEILQCLKYSGL